MDERSHNRMIKPGILDKPVNLLVNSNNHLLTWINQQQVKHDGI